MDLGSYTPILSLVIYAHLGYDCFKQGVQIFFSDLDVGAYIFYENVTIETFKNNI